MLPLHAGWTIAIVAGFATWVFSNWVITISGAAREVTEGVTALVAAVVLIWVGIWMHQQMALQDWTRNVTSRMHSAVRNQSPWWIFFLSFIAVYREMFETILFYQALWLQIDAGARGALFGGAGVALLLLLGIVWAMFKLGARLPVRQFFRVCAITLVVMAVIFVGKGIAALQEAGHLPLHSVTFPRIDLLGIYPSLEGVVAQIVVAAMAVFALTRRAAPPTPRPAAG